MTASNCRDLFSTRVLQYSALSKIQASSHIVEQLLIKVFVSYFVFQRIETRVDGSPSLLKLVLVFNQFTRFQAEFFVETSTICPLGDARTIG